MHWKANESLRVSMSRRVAAAMVVVATGQAQELEVSEDPKPKTLIALTSLSP